MISDEGEYSPTNSKGKDSRGINITSSSSSAADSFQVHESKKFKISDFVLLDKKFKIINIARQHPK